MRPLLLHGHERALTKIKYNREGDLLFSCSKDHRPNVWYSHNGERLGTYNGHVGAVWSCDVDELSTRLLTGAADNTLKIWSVHGGKCLHTIQTSSAVRSVGWAMGSERALMVTDQTMGQNSLLHFLETPEDDAPSTLRKVVVSGSKATIAVWGDLNRYVLVGHDDGSISKYDPETGTQIVTTRPHTGTIQDLQLSPDKTMFITASKDTSSQLLDAETLRPLKRFQTNRPVNAAAISPIRNHIVLGGGQEAMSVTTTAVKSGQFETRFFHSVFEEEIGRVKGHFGPVNTVAFHPSGKSYASGGEDGYVRVHHLDESYFSFRYEFEEE
ncbi:WD40 repeat-like protein [Gonapodya prolifera JEL478]|uniref:Eukaryotic translation initiation factor 3 subunit I n=1 Tax=Gonapodya prolifera (strain JEL478) TaxID=1344416 RepID=A0A139A048_GONPJ|nr:WD40 repeat-like protein [Gonapodya prolifera JEL478]|eukprot:KXS10156.1 WD40 repeat-like protein [Gonapodya prolifera JEL478]